MTFCWAKTKYVCQSSADSYLLTDAIAGFPNSKWEYKAFGTGRDTNENGKLETDCFYLVDSTLKSDGYKGLGKLGQVSTVTGQVVGNPYFCPVDFEDARPGDIIVLVGMDFLGLGDPLQLPPGHVAFIASRPTIENGSWTGLCFEASSRAGDNPDGTPNAVDFRQWHAVESIVWKDKNAFQYVYGIFRPKKAVQVWNCNPPDRPPDHALYQYHGDPLMLDLDGGGIQTVGLDAGVHFDHDGNGFKELTGWVAPGDGVLMLDKNGNGLLDDGSELFGDSTILPNGTKASNGFQALAYYDANHDGRIDTNDPIWQQLRVWQPDTYVLPQGYG